jgi:protein-S-isoprenylcysteine O-methyltransferase Ste14
MWVIRLVLLGLLIALVIACGYFLKYRKRYEIFLENRAVNLVIVVFYLLSCCLMAVLPSDPGVFPPPVFFVNPAAHIGFSVIGWILIGLALLVWVIAVWQRKALGGQDVKEGLLTSGIYQYFRHPIYVGITWMCLGLALVAGNWDGLLMFPAILLVNIAEAVIEEKYDVGVRFSSQYQEYRKQTRMFGPVWCWAVLAGSLLVVAGVVQYFYSGEI